MSGILAIYPGYSFDQVLEAIYGTLLHLQIEGSPNMQHSPAMDITTNGYVKLYVCTYITPITLEAFPRSSDTNSLR
jgi:hypothetical protein